LLKLDYAYYSPERLVIRRKGWLEQALADVRDELLEGIGAASNGRA
jgi:sulfonate transport system substrate-binding protein